MLKLSTGREAFEIEHNGHVTRWEYDVLEVKLLAEDLERQFEMRVLDDKGELTDLVKRPTAPFCDALADRLQALGCSGCTCDAAYKIYNVVNIQFARITADLQQQVTKIAYG
jgi:hypothetical protein